MDNGTWIVLADSSRARIFSTDAALTMGPVVVSDLVHPASRMRERDLVSDRPSRSFAERGAPGADISEAGARDHEVQLFAQELGEHLGAARRDGLYEGMVLVAPPRFLGLLRKQLDKATLESVHASIDKELTQLAEHEVLAAVRQRLG